MNEKKPTNIIIPSQGGVLRDLVLRIKLILRLMGDRRINFFLKLLPVASIAYLISPIDAISIPIVGALDDAAVLWLGSYLFLELAPHNVVQEHLKRLASNLEPQQDDEVVEGETTDVTDKPGEP